MKKLVLIFMATMMLVGCGMSRVATKAGVKIGQSYQESAAVGMVSAEKSIKAWPYISGLLDGIMASNYDLEVPTIAKSMIDKLDALAEKDVLTDHEKGFIIGSYCRLESLAIKYSWDRYGPKITSVFSGLAGEL